MGKRNAGRGLAKDIIIVVIGVLIIWMGLRVVFGTENPFYVVSSGSMVPELQVFDVLIVQGNDPFESVKVGDVIVFDRPAGQDRVIVHRVAAVIEENPYTIRTKGDANPASIPGTDYPITEEEYIGKVAYVVPQVGYVTRILTPPINYIIIAIIIGVMIFKQISKNKKEKEFASELDSSTHQEFEGSLNDKEEVKNPPKDPEYSSVEESEFKQDTEKNNQEKDNSEFKSNKNSENNKPEK